MPRLFRCLALLLLTRAPLAAQSPAATPSADTAAADTSRTPFRLARAKRLSPDDLRKKREGRFLTGLPELLSDPVAGEGLGAKVSIFWNGTRRDPFFAYTPYRAKLKINALATNEGARELALQLDLPFVAATRWRLKVDAKAQDNPTNLYFGLTEATLGPLTLPATGQTFTRFADFDAARKTIRPGGTGEAALVTDALSNRFREREFMLDLKADRALGDGRWRVLVGYEIQDLRYRTFSGTLTSGTTTGGAEQEVPNGQSLLAREAAAGIALGLNGGVTSILQQALIFDSRDFEPDPTRGTYFEIGNEWAGSLIGSDFAFDKLLVQMKTFRKLPIGPRTVLAGRVGVGNIFGRTAPFFEYQDQWSPDGSINALGGARSLRGYRANRFLARSLWFTNLELRARVAETTLGRQRFALAVVPFVDAGTVRDRWQDLGLRDIRWSAGAGLRLAWNQSTIISLDAARSREDRLVFLSLGQIF